MRKLFYSVLAGLLLASVGGWAEPPVPAENWVVRSDERAAVLRPVQGEREPWLGVSVHKPAEALYAQLEAVPKAVGFVVHDVTAEGPAAAAGLRQYDFLWKLNDQLLVNEAQFLVLLHLHEAGDTVTLTYQRNGENRECPVVLGERPVSERGQKEADIAVMRDPPVPGLSNQIIDILRQVAEIKGENGEAVRLERRGDGFHWQQVGADGTVMKEGDLTGPDHLATARGVDDELAKKLGVLVRALEDAERRAKSGTRPSRVRRVPVDERP